MQPGDKDYDAIADDYSKSELRFMFDTFNGADK